jgi:hypothetical protein
VYEGVKIMEPIYTIGWYKLWDECIGNDEAHRWKAFIIENVDVGGEKMNAYFCRNDKGMFVVAGKTRKWKAHRNANHRWSSGELYVDVYARKNFRTRVDGNEFYKTIKDTMKFPINGGTK